MLSRSRWRRFLPGGRRKDPVIKAVPISEAPPVLFEEGSDPEMPVSHSNQPQYSLVEPNLNIDYGRFQEAVPHTIGFGASPSQYPHGVLAVPESQHSQHYGERAITHVDYDGVQTVRSENVVHPRRRSRSRSRHRRGSRQSSKAPEIFVHPPSIANVGEHTRSGSPEPLPVLPRHHKDAYRGDRMRHREPERHHEPERHRSHRHREYDRRDDDVHDGEPGALPHMGNLPRHRTSHSITRRLKSLQHPDFLFSKCTGRKKAVCIGINYAGQHSQLDGCVNDAKNVYRFLIDRLNFQARDIIRLTDDARDPRNLPTRANILGAMRWLVRGAHKHDSLFFHYSGHGAQVRARDGDEVDGYDEVDYSDAGTIIDDDLHNYLVKPLPPGCRLTAVFDSCHSGSILDVVFSYHSDGHVKSSTVTNEFRQDKASPAEVICWSGSSDSGTAADAHEGGVAVGAMSYAFLTVLLGNPRPTYEELLRDLRRATRKYHQKPQLSTSHLIDLDRRFLI